MTSLVNFYLNLSYHLKDLNISYCKNLKKIGLNITEKISFKWTNHFSSFRFVLLLRTYKTLVAYILYVNLNFVMQLKISGRLDKILK